MSAAASAASTVAKKAMKGAKHWPHKSPTFVKVVENNLPIQISPEHDKPMGSWTSDQIRAAVTDNVMLTWAPGKARHNTPIITRGEGVYLYDDQGNKFLDWTSQAVCSNLGYDLPKTVTDATMKQMTELPYIYGGLGIVEGRARLSKLLAEILPGDLEGMVFPSSGSEANEAAIMCARRYTGKYKVINWYRSYHGGTTNSQQATGDFRRWFGGDHVPGFVKAPNPFPLFWDLAGSTEEERTQMALNMLEEQVLNEGPDTVAMIQFESVVGGGGVLVPPPGYMQGVRAICDKYNILLHCDEVMVGFGRTGKLFGFQHYDGVIPDILTAAKGLSSAALPISMMAVRKHIQEAFDDKPLGWGSTYAAHPVAVACAYENVKHLIKADVLGHVQSLAPQFEDSMRTIAENHPCIKQYRSIGLFGCFDVHTPEGKNPQLQHTAIDSAFVKYKKAYTDNRLIGLLRPPHLHVAPPLIISEDELMDGFERQDRALYALDDALGY
jgi:adenosylmethionine-8-amino-7-oxononanoate aminotransferase